jgi:hypothetical protein
MIKKRHKSQQQGNNCIHNGEVMYRLGIDTTYDITFFDLYRVDPVPRRVQ